MVLNIPQLPEYEPYNSNCMQVLMFARFPYLKVDGRSDDDLDHPTHFVEPVSKTGNDQQL